MPTYEYLCDKCQHKFEVIQSIIDPPLSICPKKHCGQAKWGKGKVHRLISTGGGLLFKGSGFYTTDYRSDSYKAAAKKDTAPAPAPAPASSDKSSDKSSPTKSETKPVSPKT